MLQVKGHFILAGVAAVLSLGAAGCGPAAIDQFASDAGSAAKALADGAELNGKAGGVSSDFSEPGSSKVAKNTFSIRRNDTGGVDISVEDQTAAFAAADAHANGFGWRKEDGTKINELYSWNGKIADVLNEEDKNYSQIWEYYLYDDATKKELAGFTTTGTYTDPDTLKSRPTATFDGYMVARTWGKMNPHNQSQFEAGTDAAKGIYGAGNTGVTMTADFAGGTIEGEIKGITSAWNGGGGPLGPAGAIAGSMKMGKATISDSGVYEGAITNNGMPMDLGTSTYMGDFYGPEAEETAGVISIDTPTQAGSGAFRAFKQ